MGTFDAQSRLSLQKLVNEMLSAAPRDMKFDDGTVDIDYSFVGQGVAVTDEYFSVILDGTVSSVQHKNVSATKKYTKMPLHDPDGAEVQMMISEYSLNSML